MQTEKLEKPSWVKMKPAELEGTIIELFNEEKNPAKIGLILRDKHGIPKSKLLGKKITQILRENKKDCTKEGEIVAKRVEKIQAHLKNNKNDQPAKRALTKKLWAIRRINKIALQ